MVRVSSLDENFNREVFAQSSCCFGVFDGFHRGHRYIVDAARCSGGAGPVVAITFDIDPDEMFRKGDFVKLQTNEMRIESLAASGVDVVVVLPFTKEMAQMTPGRFVSHCFADCAPQHMHVGEDFRFGARGLGTVADLQDLLGSQGTQVHAHGLLVSEGQPVTSTRIRHLLAAGNVEQANELLGHRYMIEDVVRPGRSEGRSMGFATANFEVPRTMLAVGEGVYGGVAVLGSSRYRAAIAVGRSPVFSELTTSNVEVHLLDFDEPLYGQRMRVEFHAWIRPMIEFETVGQLSATVQDNIAWVRDNIDIGNENGEC